MRLIGTVVRLFPQSEGYDEPVPVELSKPLGSVGPGPTDATLRTVLPVDKRRPYDPPTYLPPYRGPVLPRAQPGRDGSFTEIPLDTPEFLSQHLYGGIRRTLDCWERYLGRPVIWWHSAELPQLELIPIVDWNNAHSGPGFIETGIRRTAEGAERLFALNMDVIAHETGHAILFSEVGVPHEDRLTAGYLAFQESFSDLIALVTALHFPMVVDRMLTETRGNLYVLNEVSRIGELSHVEQIRIADNETTMDDVADVQMNPDGTWIDLAGLSRTQHSVAQPLTGAIFDVLVDLYQDNLVAAGVLPEEADARGWDEARVEAGLARIEAISGDALAANSRAFHWALARARDDVGATMARAMITLDPDGLTFDAVAASMIRAAADLGVGRIGSAFVENFLWRGIDPRPALLGGQSRAGRWRYLSFVERRDRLMALRRNRSRAEPSMGDYVSMSNMVPPYVWEIGTESASG